MPVLNDNSRRGGLSDDKFTGQQLSFQDGERINIIKKPHALELAYKSIDATKTTTFDERIRVIIDAFSPDYIVTFLENGKVYSGNGTEGRAQVSTGLLVNPRNAIQYNEELVMATNSSLYYITKTNVINKTWGGNVNTINALENVDYHPMVEIFNVLYVANGNKIASYDYLGLFEDGLIEIPKEQTIKFLTYDGSLMKIYADGQDGATVYFRDCINEVSYNQYSKLGFIEIYGVATLENIDYIMTRDKSTSLLPTGSLYLLNGRQLELLKTDISVNQVGGSYCMQAIKDSVYICGQFCVQRWGRKNRNYGYGLSNVYYPTIDMGTGPGGLTSIYNLRGANKDLIYFGYVKESDYGIDLVDSEKYASTGHVISRVYDGGTPRLEKKIDEVSLSFEKLTTGQTIKLDIKENFGNLWKNIMTVSHAVDGGDITNIKYEGAAITTPNIELFNFLEYRITLETTVETTTPTIYNLYIKWDYADR